MHKYTGHVCIIGGGASGIVAAISARRRGREVVLVDRMASIGKKILACGAGRCNLLNERFDDSFYNESARPLVRSVLERFGKTAIKDFFSDIGLVMYSEGERIFPVTNQSSSVLGLLSAQAQRLGTTVLTGFQAESIQKTQDGFVVRAKNGSTVRCEKVIIAAGGKSYPGLGSDGSGLSLAAGLGHSIVEAVPAAVPLIVRDPLCHALQGQRIAAAVQLCIDGRPVRSSEGDLLFARYGLSGTAVLDVSRDASVALHRRSGAEVVLVVDMVPFMRLDALKAQIVRRIEEGFSRDQLLSGILPDKFNRSFQRLMARDQVEVLSAELKAKRFSVSGTRGWDEAEFTAGGVSTDEVTHGTLESAVRQGVYFCGEVLDVDGVRGGYNLGWAWSSGFVAGLMQ